MFQAFSLGRRGLLLGLAGALASCGRRADTTTAAAPLAPPKPAPKAKANAAPRDLAWAVQGPWRGEEAKRDAWRHPRATLEFFGLKPGMTVVEMWPGAGWYSQILAPFLTATGGKLYAATFTPAADDAAAARIVAAYAKQLQERKDLYGAVSLTRFGPASGPVAPAGSADLVVFMQTLHLWMAGGLAEKAFRDAFAVLKPGAALGIEAHRAPAGSPQDPLAAQGYVQESYVRQLAEEAGFRFAAASEVNANPKDTHDHPFGVATLAPERRTAPAGQPPNPAFDRARFDAIGESDRMTLRFVKP